MSLQEIFDKTVNHLRQQGEKATKDGGHSCQYRLVKNGKTLKCAVGVHIPDEKYSANLENNPLYHGSGMIWKFLGDLGFSEQERYLLHQLQKAHDQYSKYHWEEEFESIAEKYNLVYSKATS